MFDRPTWEAAYKRVGINAAAAMLDEISYEEYDGIEEGEPTARYKALSDLLAAMEKAKARKQAALPAARSKSGPPPAPSRRRSQRKN